MFTYAEKAGRANISHWLPLTANVRKMINQSRHGVGSRLVCMWVCVRVPVFPPCEVLCRMPTAHSVNRCQSLMLWVSAPQLAFFFFWVGWGSLALSKSPWRNLDCFFVRYSTKDTQAHSSCQEYTWTRKHLLPELAIKHEKGDRGLHLFRITTHTETHLNTP